MKDISGSISATSASNTYDTNDSDSHHQSPLGGKQLKFVRSVALSVGIQGPVAGVIVGPAVLASIVGGSGALAYLLGLIAMAFVAYAFVIFSKRFNTSSSVYAFNSVALGPSYGFISAWILLLVYLSFAAGVYASTADIAQTFLSSFGIDINWVLIALVGFVLTMIFAYRSIRISTMVIFVCEGVAIALLSIVGIAVMVKGGYHHHVFSDSPFLLHGISMSVLGLGVVNAFSAFSGFEGATTLGEETKKSTKYIPLAVGISLVASAFIYIIFTFIANNAYPNPGSLAKDPAPFVHLAQIYLSPFMGNVVNFAGIISAFGAQLACINAANRLLYSAGRDFGSKNKLSFLKLTHKKFNSPIGALVISGSLTLIALLSFSFEKTPIEALIVIVQYGAYLIIVAYLMTVIAALKFVNSKHFSLIKSAILIAGILILGFVLYDTFHPFPAAPYSWDVWAAILSIVVGIVLVLKKSVRTKLKGSVLLTELNGQ